MYRLAEAVVNEAARIGGDGGAVFTLAESCTGGLAASTLVRVPGVSAWFPGSLVTYSDISKIELLNVSPETIERHGAVSGECAAEMAWGALHRFHTRAAVSITGIAGPDGGSVKKPVGTVWCASCVDDGRVRLVRCLYPGKTRALVQAQAVEAALRLLLTTLEDI